MTQSKRGGTRPGAGRPSRVADQARKLLSTRISQEQWALIKIYAEVEKIPFSEVIERLLALGLAQPPFSTFIEDQTTITTHEDRMEHLAAKKR